MPGKLDDPKYKAAAEQIAAAEPEPSSAWAWCLQDDGTLTVVMWNGKKINRPLPAIEVVEIPSAPFSATFNNPPQVMTLPTHPAIPPAKAPAKRRPPRGEARERAQR